MDFEQVFQKFDVDNDGVLTFKEFAKSMQWVRGNASSCCFSLLCCAVLCIVHHSFCRP